MNERDYILFESVCFLIAFLFLFIGLFLLQVFRGFTVFNILILSITSLSLVVTGFYFHYKKQRYIYDMLQIINRKVDNGKDNNDKVS